MLFGDFDIILASMASRNQKSLKNMIPTEAKFYKQSYYFPETEKEKFPEQFSLQDTTRKYLVINDSCLQNNQLNGAFECQSLACPTIEYDENFIEKYKHMKISKWDKCETLKPIFEIPYKNAPNQFYSLLGKDSMTPEEQSNKIRLKKIKFQSEKLSLDLNPKVSIWNKFLQKPRLNIFSQAELIKQRNLINQVENKS